MTRNIPVAIVCVAAVLIPSRPAAAVTAAEMLSHCVGVVNARHLPGSEGKVQFQTDFPAGICWGAFGAIQDLMVITWAGEASPVLDICAPPESTLVQLVRIFDSYTRAHPEKQHRDFGEVALASLLAAFRCPPAVPATAGNR
jgi:hypothetical protein